MCAKVMPFRLDSGGKKSPKFIINQGVLVNKGFTRTKSFSNKATGKTRTGISTKSGEQWTGHWDVVQRNARDIYHLRQGIFSVYICIDSLIVLQKSREDRGRRTSGWFRSHWVHRYERTSTPRHIFQLELGINPRVSLL